MDESKNTQTEPQELENLPVKPIYSLHISHDYLEVEMEMQHGGLNTLDPVYEDIIAVLEESGVKYGIREDTIRGICEHPAYGRSYLVARGAAAETGADGYLKFLIETDRPMRPKERADGTVDYRDLGFIQNITKGQPICQIHAAEKGADGMDIYGNVIEGRFGKEPPSPLGKNTEINADETMLVASCDGSVSVTKGIATVIDQLRINGNVDNSTGDLNFVGDIVIKGDVIAGFSVTAKGNIVMQGSVEGAKIEATGDINISEGVNGMDRGKVMAGGSVKCRYMQSCFIKAGKDIYSDTIMYSTIECDGNLELAGQRGRLIAGRATVAGYVKAATIGTDSHVPTVVSINSAAGANQEIQALTAQINGMNQEEIKLQQLFARIADLRAKNRLTPDLVPMMETAAQNYKLLQDNRTKAQQALEAAKTEQLRRQTQATDSYISCKGRIHAGVTLQFGPLTTQITQSMVNTRVMIIDGDISFMNQ